PDGGQGDDWIACSEWIVDNLPVLAIAQYIGADQAAQGNERQAFLAGLERGVDRRTCGIHDLDACGANGFDEARRGAEFTHGNSRSLDSADTAGADQHIRLQPARWHANQVQVTNATLDQFAGRGHRDTGRIFGYGKQRPVRDCTHECFERGQGSCAHDRRAKDRSEKPLWRGSPHASNRLTPFGFGRLQRMRVQLDRLALIGNPYLSVLDGVLQLHVAGGESGEGSGARLWEIDDREFVRTRQLVPRLLPPELRCMAAVGVNENFVGPAARLADAFFVRKSDVDPGLYASREILAPQVRFVIGAQSRAECE